MLPLGEFCYDVASAISVGQRDYQEDALVTDFPNGAGFGFAVVADGMGGHAAGDVASKIVVTEVFSELKLCSGDPKVMEEGIDDILRDAVANANDCVRLHSENSPDTAGMGTTLIAPVLMQNRLYWISVGDSPLYLYRQGTLLRLNEDHSLVPQIDYLVSKGLLLREEADSHPDRNCLTSVLAGQPIPQIDCPSAPVQLFHDDIIIAASDGLQFLEEMQIAETLRGGAHLSSSDIAARLMTGVENLADPDQDNVSLCIVKVADSAKFRAETQHRASDQGVGYVDTKVAPLRQRRNALTVMATVSGKTAAMTYNVTS